MEVWVWVLAYLVGFALLQVVLYRYFSKSTTKPPEQTTPVAEGGALTVDVPEDVPDGDLVSCDSCGTYNENHPMFLFCRSCGERL